MSTPVIRRMRASIAGISRHDRDDPDLPGLRHQLAVEQAAAVLAALDHRRMTEDERARLRWILGGRPDPGTGFRCDPPGPGSHPQPADQRGNSAKALSCVPGIQLGTLAEHPRDYTWITTPF